MVAQSIDFVGTVVHAFKYKAVKLSMGL